MLDQILNSMMYSGFIKILNRRNFFFRIDGKWSERSERPFRRGVRGPPRPPEADDKMMQNPGIWAFPGR